MRGGTRPGGRGFQSTRPARGETKESWSIQFWDDISIHSPRKGRDASASSPFSPSIYFNPLAPQGARRGKTTLKLGGGKFQSTRPARGETGGGRRCSSSVEISIHSPRKGRDSVQYVQTGSKTKFQSTRPARGETSKPAHLGARGVISIHSPRKGRDRYGYLYVRYPECISIHSPRKGRDMSSTRC